MFDDLKKEVGQMTSVVQSAVTAFTGLKTRLATAEANLASQGADTSELQGIISELSTDRASLAAAIADNTAAASEPAPAPADAVAAADAAVAADTSSAAPDQTTGG